MIKKIYKDEIVKKLELKLCVVLRLKCQLVLNQQMPYGETLCSVMIKHFQGMLLRYVVDPEAWNNYQHVY